jgi:hypothetical protein
MTCLSPAILAKNPNEPVCSSCAKGLGAKPMFKTMTVSVEPCCLCGSRVPCTAIRDWTWPTTQPAPLERKRYWQQPDDYSELETILGRRS